jgi:hypothetical protein
MYELKLQLLIMQIINKLETELFVVFQVLYLPNNGVLNDHQTQIPALYIYNWSDCDELLCVFALQEYND